MDSCIETEFFEVEFGQLYELIYDLNDNIIYQQQFSFFICVYYVYIIFLIMYLVIREFVLVFFYRVVYNF